MTDIVSTVFNVFTSVGTWFIDSLADFVAMFYNAETGLTFIGVMALVGIGLAVARMLFAIITSFVQLRGGR